MVLSILFDLYLHLTDLKMSMDCKKIKLLFLVLYMQPYAQCATR